MNIVGEMEAGECDRDNEDDDVDTEGDEGASEVVRWRRVFLHSYSQMFAGSVFGGLATLVNNVTRSEARVARWKGKNDDQETIWILGGVDKDAGLFQKCLPVTKPGKGSCTK